MTATPRAWPSHRCRPVRQPAEDAFRVAADCRGRESGRWDGAVISSDFLALDRELPVGAVVAGAMSVQDWLRPVTGRWAKPAIDPDETSAVRISPPRSCRSDSLTRTRRSPSSGRHTLASRRLRHGARRETVRAHPFGSPSCSSRPRGRSSSKAAAYLDAVLAVRAVMAWCDAGGGGGETAYVAADEPYMRPN